MEQKWDAVIIGGGLGGYVALNYLTMDGLSVLLLEKAKKGGGRAQTTTIKGQSFNLGPHALYKKGLARPILEELGVELSGKSPALGGLLIDRDTEFAAPFNPASVLSTRFLSAKERIEWLGFVVKLKGIDTRKLAGITFGEWLGVTGYSENVKTLVMLLGKLATYCDAPEQAEAKVILSHLKAVMAGVLYLDGGWQTMVDQLHNRAVISGVEVRTSAHVKEITPLAGENLKVTLASGETIYAKHVISTAAPADLARMVDSSADFLERHFLNEIVPVTGAALDVALTRLPDPKRLFAMSLSDSLYYSVHSNYARLSENATAAVLHVFHYHAPGEAPDPNEMKQRLEQFLDQLQPGWREFKITSRFMPHLTVNQRLPRVGDAEQLLRAETSIPGLYIAGDWASPHAMLSDGAVASGKLAADEIRKKERGAARAADERRIQAI